jgi:uncharacterized protein (DUF885 family)
MSTTVPAHAAKVSWQQQFQKLSDEYFDQVYFHYGPTNGTAVGFHQYDGQLEDFSHKTIDAEIAQLKEFLPKIGKIKQEYFSDEKKKEQRLPAGAPGSSGVQFKATTSPEGKIRIVGIVRQDPALSPEQVAMLEQKAYAFQYHPYKLNGVPVEVPTTINVYLDETYDPVFADLEIVESNIKSQLLTLETIRPSAKNADNYSSTCAGAAFVLMERKFAPPEDRLRSLIAREKQMPALLKEARVNLDNPPRIFTEIAIEQLPGIISFFQHDVPAAFTSVQDAGLKTEFAQSNAAVIVALQSYLTWLKSDLLARSSGDFRIGADTFHKKLEFDEMVDIPLDRLLEIGWADLHKNQAQFKLVAAELEPDKSPQQVLEELGEDHPAPDQLLNSFRATFNGLIAFIRSHHIVTIPSDVQPIVEETPPFMRATTFASMDTPGPYETHAKEAYFNVTLPEPSMKPAEVEGFMHSFNIGTVISTAVHEAYPGHYVQFLWVPQAPSKVRRILGANTNVEGWAHYCEQMMLDEGYGQPGAGAKDKRESEFLRLGQLQDALLRDARFIVGIQMHTGNMSIEQAEEFFQKDGYQSRESAIIETKRGAGDPTYLYYTLGKLEIMKLRSDVMEKQGAAFSLEKFHDNFLRQGFPPVKIVREAMLGDNSPVL